MPGDWAGVGFRNGAGNGVGYYGRGNRNGAKARHGAGDKHGDSTGDGVGDEVGHGTGVGMLSPISSPTLDPSKPHVQP